MADNNACSLPCCADNNNACSLPCCADNNPRYILKTIKDYLAEFGNIKERENKVEKVKIILTYTVAHKWFLGDYESFNKMLRDKFIELNGQGLDCDEYSIEYFGVPVDDLLV